MAIVLRNTRTGFFYAGYNRWRIDPTQAYDFETAERAADWIGTIRLPGVEIIQTRQARGSGTDRQTCNPASGGMPNGQASAA